MLAVLMSLLAWGLISEYLRAESGERQRTSHLPTRSTNSSTDSGAQVWKWPNLSDAKKNLQLCEPKPNYLITFSRSLRFMAISWGKGMLDPTGFVSLYRKNPFLLTAAILPHESPVCFCLTCCLIESLLGLAKPQERQNQLNKWESTCSNSFAPFRPQKGHSFSSDLRIHATTLLAISWIRKSQYCHSISKSIGLPGLRWASVHSRGRRWGWI